MPPPLNFLVNLTQISIHPLKMSEKVKKNNQKTTNYSLYGVTFFLKVMILFNILCYTFYTHIHFMRFYFVGRGM